jgi:hypothetical protein
MRRDGTALLAPTDLQDPVPGLLGLKFDPTVVFDQYTDAFVLAFIVRRPLTQESWIVVTTIPDATAADRSTWARPRSAATAPAETVWRLREASRGPTLRRSAIAVGRERIAPFGTQAGGSTATRDTWWHPGDLRLVNAFHDADLDRVYAAHILFGDLQPDRITRGSPEAAIKWYQVHPRAGSRPRG